MLNIIHKLICDSNLFSDVEVPVSCFFLVYMFLLPFLFPVLKKILICKGFHSLNFADSFLCCLLIGLNCLAGALHPSNELALNTSPTPQFATLLIMAEVIFMWWNS